MKIHLSIGITVLLSTLFLTSCQSLEQISIDYMRPASITFPPQYRKVAIVNNTLDSADKKFISEEKEPDEQHLEASRVIGYAHGNAKVLAESLAQAIADQNYFDVVVICDSALRENDKYYRQNTLTSQEVKKLASNLNVDLIIAVEDIIFKTTRSIYYIPDIDGFQGITTLKAYPTFCIYAPEKKSPIKRLLLNDSIYWDNLSISINETSQLMIPDEELLKEGNDFAGNILIKYITPTWNTTERYFFTGNTVPMRDAAEYVRNHSWDEAYQLWKYVFENTKKQKRRMQAAFNIALYYEMKDDITQAEIWAQKAQEIAQLIDKINLEEKKENDTQIYNYRNYYLTSQYVIQLKKRKAELLKLNKQMERFNIEPQ